MNQPSHFDLSSAHFSDASYANRSPVRDMLTIAMASPRQLDHLAITAYCYDAPRIKLIAANGRLQDAMRMCRSRRPDAVLLDVAYPDRSAYVEARRLVADGYDGQLVFIDDRLAVWRANLAVQIPKSCFFTRQGQLSELCDYLTRQISAHAWKGAPSPSRTGSRYLVEGAQSLKQHDAHGLLTLSEKEIDVLRRLADGQPAKEIAAIKGLSVKTIDNHKTRIMRKLSARRMVELTRIAFETGLIGAA